MNVFFRHSKLYYIYFQPILTAKQFILSALSFTAMFKLVTISAPIVTDMPLRISALLR